ncbi:MAG: aspartate aminotransferase family protein [Gammaproteobacteria bacterium]|nr:MAG: aspartate aminotransferase family protein [Gammaproteobacteria bacterium]
MSDHHLMSTYARLPVHFSHGEGAWLWDTQGRRYLDALSGIAVCNLGHAHPEITEALCRQAGKLVHCSNLYEIPLQERLAEALCDRSGMERAFFCNSGAEANEALIKLARAHAHRQGNRNPVIVVMEQSFHGRTLATLTATGNRRVQAGFEPLLAGFVRVPFDDLASLEALARDRQDIAAVLVEPIQGEGGVRVPSPGYLNGLRRLCDAQGWLLLYDEVQTGLGRTGRWFGYQHETEARPDAMALAKALGNGVPIGACLARGAAAEAFQPGSHGSTFGGNPLACSAALAVLHVMERDRLVERADAIGDRLLAGFRARLGDREGIREIRGRGLMIGIELDRDAGALVRMGLERGLLVNVTAGNVLRLLPPLVLDEEQEGLLLDGVCALVEDYLAPPAECAS